MRVLTEFSDEGYPGYAIDTIKVTFLNDKTGTKKIKYVSVEDYATLIKNGLCNTGTTYMIGKLPTGYYNASIGMNKKGFACEAILVLPKKMHYITYMQSMYNMELPSLVFAFKVENNMVLETHVFCVKKEEMSPDARLYRFPLGNVSPDSGRVCWGANQLPKVKCLKDLDMIMTYFISSPFNSDHFRPNENCRIKNFNVRELCIYVQSQGRFDEEQILRPITIAGYRTMGELQKKMNL